MMKLFTALSALLQLSVIVSIAAEKDCSGTDEWDVIVVGAGLSGSIVAAEIATKAPGKCVLLLEGGKNSGQLVPDAQTDESLESFFEKGWTTVHENETLFNTPATYGNMICWDQISCSYIWDTPKGFTVGKVVGGGGAVNGALMQYPPDSNWDPYPDGWKASDMHEYLDKIHTTMPYTGTPSADGLHYNDDSGADVVKEALKLKGFVESSDAAYMKPQPNTMGIPKVLSINGRRASTTSVFLKPVYENNKNFKLQIESEVVKIIFDESVKGKATGLLYKYHDSERVANLSEGGRVVLAASAMKTPELLLKSGVGPGLMIDNPAVGNPISDKACSCQKYYKNTTDAPEVKAYNLKNPPEEDQRRFVESGTGPLTQFGPLIVGFFEVNKPSQVDGKKNMVEFFVNRADKDNELLVQYVHLTPKKGILKYVLKEDGTVAFNLEDTPPFDGKFSTDSIIAADEMMYKALQEIGYERFEKEKQPGHCFQRGWSNNMNHPGGSCALGECVSADTLIVHGLKNVAVCDSSLVPEQTVVHTAFPLMAIALHAADILVRDISDTQKDEL